MTTEQIPAGIGAGLFTLAIFTDIELTATPCTCGVLTITTDGECKLQTQLSGAGNVSCDRKWWLLEPGKGTEARLQPFCRLSDSYLLRV